MNIDFWLGVFCGAVICVFPYVALLKKYEKETMRLFNELMFFKNKSYGLEKRLKYPEQKSDKPRPLSPPDQVNHLKL